MYTHVQVSAILKKKEDKPESLTSYHFSATVYSFFQISQKVVLHLLILPPHLHLLDSLHCDFCLHFLADAEHIMGVHDLHITKFKGYVFAWTLLEISAAFDAVDHFFLLENLSSLDFFHDVLSPDSLLTVSAQFSCVFFFLSFYSLCWLPKCCHSQSLVLSPFLFSPYVVFLGMH